MSYIDSSTASPLSALANQPDTPEPPAPDIGEAEQTEEEAEREPRTRRAADTAKQRLLDQIGDINLARYMPDDELDRIGMQCIEEYKLDELSRAEWRDNAMKAMRFAMQKTQPKTSPWAGASNIIYPLIGMAAIEFAERAYPAIVQGQKVVKGTIWGSDRGTPARVGGKPDGQPVMQPPAQPGAPPQPVWLIAPGEKRKRADRIADHMSWQLLHEMREWEPQTDQMLHQIPIVGGMGRKSFRDPVLGRNRSLTVSLMNLVWSYHAPSFDDAPRHSQKMLYYPYEVKEFERFGDEGDGGMWLEYDYGPGAVADGMTYAFDEELAEASATDPDAPLLFIEQHRRLDLDEDGYPEPYIVTVHLRSGKVTRIVARYGEDDIQASEDEQTILRVDPEAQYTLYPFLPNFEGGSYPMGFGHLLEAINEGINTTLNQMFDAGTLQNSGGGFVSNQLDIPSGETLFRVGRFARVNTRGQSIRDAIFPMDWKGPSPTLFQLLGTLTQAGEKFAMVADVLQGDAAIANAPPTTVLALIEQGMKGYTAIYKRVWRAEKDELAKLYRLNKQAFADLDDDDKVMRYQAGDDWLEVTEEDYRLGGGVEPIADPTQTTDMQKLGRAQIIMSTLEMPFINKQEAVRRLYEAAGVDRQEDLFLPPDPTQQMIAMAQVQAELGKTRSEEQKNLTQAFLNLALARKNATDAEMGQIDAAMTYYRLQIEAVNAETKQAMARHAHLSTAMDFVSDHLDRMHDAAMQASQAMQQAAQPTPGPTGPPPSLGAAPAGPAVTKPAPGGPPADLAPEDTPPVLQRPAPGI